MTDPKRRNGYYPWQTYQFPSVSTILKSAGNSEGLVRWAAQQGGKGVIYALLPYVTDAGTLGARLGTAACLEWAVEAAAQGLKAESERVTNFGTHAHAGIEAHLQHQDYDFAAVTPQVQQAVQTFQTWFGTMDFVVRHVETTLYAPYAESGPFAGRCDLLVEATAATCTQLQPYLVRSSTVPQPGLWVVDIKTGSLYPEKHGVQLAAYAVGANQTWDWTITGGLVVNIPRDQPEHVKCSFWDTPALTDAYFRGFCPAYRTWWYFDAPRWFQQQEIPVAPAVQKASNQ